VIGVAAQVVGWAGAATLLAAYVMTSSGHWAGESRAFNVANMAGGAMLAFGGFFVGAWPSVTLNLIWIIVGLRALRPGWTVVRADS
jgi:hypothetical protein